MDSKPKAIPSFPLSPIPHKYQVVFIGKIAKRIRTLNKTLIKFCDQTTDSERNIQRGYMHMLEGALSALRNPRAHANIAYRQKWQCENSCLQVC